MTAGRCQHDKGRQPDSGNLSRTLARGDGCPFRSRHADGCYAPFSSFTFPFFFLIFQSLSPTYFLSLLHPPPSAILSFSTQFLHQISPFYFIFFTFYTPTTLILQIFSFFLLIQPISPPKPLTLTFLSLKI